MAKVDIAINSRQKPRWISNPGRRGRISHFFFLVLLTSFHSFAQTSKPTESQVKAAYLYNFGKFVTWPVDQTAPSETFGICVLGKDPFGPVLDQTVSGEQIGGKKIIVRRIQKIGDGRVCNIVFVSASEVNHLPGVIEQAEHMHILTVSDIPNFAERGGTIGLINLDDRIRFEVNRTRAAESHLGLSSELLKVAVKVIGATQGGN